MSMKQDHAQAIADKLAIDEEGCEFQQLPQAIQRELFKRGKITAELELVNLTRNDKERLLYAEAQDK